MNCLRTILTAAVMLVAAYPSAGNIKYHGTLSSAGDTSIVYALDGESLFQAFEVRASLPAVKERSTLTDHYGFRWHTSSPDSIVEIIIAPMLAGEGSVIETSVVEITGRLLTPEGERQLFKETVTDGIGPGRQYNSVALESLTGKELTITAGKDEMRRIAALYRNLTLVDSIEFFSKGKINVSDIIVETQPDPARELATDWTVDDLTTHFAGARKPHEGFWEYLDRQTDDGYARLGGNYRIGIVSDNNGGYNLIYTDGARTLQHRWKPGMIKARLRPTMFENHFNLSWFDATMKEHSEECYAQFDTNDAVLSINLPLLHAVLRFSRVMPSPTDR